VVCPVGVRDESEARKVLLSAMFWVGTVKVWRIAAKDGQNNSCEKQGEMDRITVRRRKVKLSKVRI